MHICSDAARLLLAVRASHVHSCPAQKFIVSISSVGEHDCCIGHRCCGVCDCNVQCMPVIVQMNLAQMTLVTGSLPLSYLVLLRQYTSTTVLCAHLLAVISLCVVFLRAFRGLGEQHCSTAMRTCSRKQSAGERHVQCMFDQLEQSQDVNLQGHLSGIPWPFDYCHHIITSGLLSCVACDEGRRCPSLQKQQSEGIFLKQPIPCAV